jgi:hypothetical protein
MKPAASIRMGVVDSGREGPRQEFGLKTAGGDLPTHRAN